MVLGLSFIIFHLSFSSVAAQSWSSKAAKSVFTLKTFGADGHLTGSAIGFFISEEGDAVSSFTPFIGAVRAVVIDASGKELPVEHMLGANEMYDVAKFRVTGKKLQPLQVVSGGMPLLSEGVGGNGEDADAGEYRRLSPVECQRRGAWHHAAACPSG